MPPLVDSCKCIRSGSIVVLEPLASLFAMIQFRDGPFIRPHPAFWRIVLGINLIYELTMVFLLFQDLDTARGYMVLLDSNLGVPLEEKSYAEDCTLTWLTLWVSGACHTGQNSTELLCRMLSTYLYDITSTFDARMLNCLSALPIH